MPKLFFFFLVLCPLQSSIVQALNDINIFDDVSQSCKVCGGRRRSWDFRDSFLHWFENVKWVFFFFFLRCYCWKYECAQRKINGSTSLENDNMCYVSFRIWEQENVYLDVVKFKTEDQKFLERLLIFTPIPLNAQDVWSLNQFPRRE